MRKVAFALSLSALTLASCNAVGTPDGGSTNSDGTDIEATDSNGPAEGAETADAGATDASAGSGGMSQDGYLDKEIGQIALRDQKRAIIAEELLLTARDKRSRLRFDEAAEALESALLLTPDNQEIREELLEVKQLLGDTQGVASAATDDLETRWNLKQQELRAKAETALENGQRELARGNYDAAINEFVLAREHARFAPVEMADDGIAERAESLLAQARTARTDAAESARAKAEEQTAALLRQEREAEDARRANRVNAVLEQAIGAFDAGAYDTSIELADRVLQEDPRNDRAIELRDAAFQAGRKEVRESYIERKREQFQRWEQEIRALRIADTEIIGLPDAEFWAKISETRGQATLSGGSQTSAADVALRANLAQRSIPGLVVQDEESLSAVISNLRAITGLALVVDAAAEEAAYDEGVIFDLRLENPMSVDKVLNLITDLAGEQVTWTVRHEAVLVTTIEKAQGDHVPQVHDVQDILFALTNFLSPRLERLRLFEDIEDDDGGGPFGGLTEGQTLMEPDTLEGLVRENVAIGTWDNDGVSLQVLDTGYLVAVHTNEVQAEVRQFLDDLRKFNSSLVTIESKFLTVADNFIQEIGVEWRGLDNPGDPFTDLDDVTNGLDDNANAGFDNGGGGVNVSNAAGPPSAGFFYDDGGDGDFKGSTSNIFGTSLGKALSTVGGMTTQWTVLDDAQLSFILRMIEKDEQVEVVNDQTLSVFNTQRSYVSVINQRAYIQDFDVEVATAQAIADPVINVLIEGVVLEVRPTITQDRKYIRMEIRPTVAEVVSLTTFSTNLGGTVGQPVEFELPELEVQHIATTAVIPDGGSILLGGLSRVRNIERRAEVPWLAKIPIVGFFFKEEGYSDEKESLMILLKAWITDVQEEIARLERR
ncbi:hypothetical protein [Engelhardtia mirabilis]